MPASEKSQQIGPYKLLQKLGEGGMGTVWMAEQTVPVKRRVALKVIKAGLDNKQVIARFEAERQALAMMNHENIARILDGGTTETGQPYFVMELVQGIPFTKYCDQHKLSIKDRLELFIPVCKAIQHAHQKGIIHRDLKPSNVLVILYDGKPVPKVIDFGLAKALEHTTHLTDKTMFTEFGQVVGTLQYMSPEQAEMNQLDIDTRTDIYSLGVMLYELLTGSTPIEAETLKKNAILKVLATIRETDPPRPSARLSSSTNEAVSGISSQRQIDPTRLKNILRGELDWIVMKSIEKDRSRRYETANNFADDINRYLEGEVIIARPPSTSYRLRKYVRRHKGLVASACSVIGLLVIGVIGTSWGFRQAKLANVKLEAERTKTQNALDVSEADLARSNHFVANARWNEGRVRAANQSLESIPRHHRNLEWHLSRRRFQGSDLTLFGHTNSVTCVAFSPDGKWIASGSQDKSIKVWSPISGAQIHSLEGHSEPVRCIALTYDGKRLASGSDDKTVRVWDVSSGKLLTAISEITFEVNSISYSRDGTQIAIVGNSNSVVIFNASTGSYLFFDGHSVRMS